jgi:hypothetical protein
MADNARLCAQLEARVLAELGVSGMIGVSLENALQRSSIQGSHQADVDGLTEGNIA